MMRNDPTPPNEFDALPRKMAIFRSHACRKMKSHEMWSAEEAAPNFKTRRPRRGKQDDQETKS